MKITRTGVFETNSSSTHSLTMNFGDIPKDCVFYRDVKDVLGGREKFNELVDNLKKELPLKLSDICNRFNEVGEFKATTSKSKLAYMMLTVLARQSDMVNFVLQDVSSEVLKEFIYQTLQNDILTSDIAYDLSGNIYSNDFSTILEIDVDPKESIFSPNLSSQYDLDHVLDPYKMLVSMIKNVGYYGCLDMGDLVMNFLLNPECSYHYFDRDVGDERCKELL